MDWKSSLNQAEISHFEVPRPEKPAGLVNEPTG